MKGKEYLEIKVMELEDKLDNLEPHQTKEIKDTSLKLECLRWQLLELNNK